MLDYSRLLIIIRDDGVGFDADEKSRDSVGLSNTIKRLELFSGDSSFQIDSSPGNGCRCEIILPV